MSIPYVETSRLKSLDNKILKEYADVDYQDVISKELNKITHHSFVIPKDRIDEFDGIKIEDEAKNGSLEIDVYIDDENETRSEERRVGKECRTRREVDQ